MVFLIFFYELREVKVQKLEQLKRNRHHIIGNCKSEGVKDHRTLRRQLVKE
jgi:hypothetical protein